MPRVVAENEVDSMEAFYQRGQVVASPSLGEFLKFVGDIRKEANGDETQAHRVLEMSETRNEPRSLPFVLKFNNMTYSVKVRRKMAVPSLFDRRERLGDSSIGNEHLFSRSKVLSNDIYDEARDGELVAVLGVIGSGKSTWRRTMSEEVEEYKET
ncbi:hypothetical protein Lser_V15G16184 [Lactuca serriola]